MAEELIKWKILVTGRETIENRKIERVKNKEVKVYGTAFLEFTASIEITLPKKFAPNKKFYGRISNSRVTGYNAFYRPADVYKIKNKKLSANFVKLINNRSIIGFMPDPDRLQLNWPTPSDFYEPAVIVVCDDLVKPGTDAEACFSADHLFDYISSYQLELNNGWSKQFSHLFDGVLLRKRVDYEFRMNCKT